MEGCDNGGLGVTTTIVALTCDGISSNDSTIYRQLLGHSGSVVCKLGAHVNVSIHESVVLTG